MFPIPDRIIGSRQLFIPLAYIGVTVTLCYYFLLGFVHTATNLTFEQQQPLFSEQSSNNIYSADGSLYDDEDHVHNHIIVGNLEDFESDSQNDHHSSNFEGKERERRAEENKGEGQKNLLPSFSSAESQNQNHNQLNDESPGDNTREIDQESFASNPKQNIHNGTRRSEPSEIRSRRQDSPDWIDLKSRQFFPWPEDEECKHFSVRFAKPRTFKPRALVSYPGSGNSWIRYVIDGSSGIFTGSIYQDRTLIKDGLLGESRGPTDGTTIAQKTHYVTISKMSEKQVNLTKMQTERFFGYRGILIIRNPYDALRSYWNFKKTRGHTKVARPNENNLQEFTNWEQLVNEGSARWAELIETWIEESPDLLIVVYEEMKKNPRRELTRILHYLDYPIENERVNCVLKHIEGPFHRKAPTKSKKISYHAHHSHLDLIVEQHIDYINRLFAVKDIPLRLNYTLTD